MYINTKTNKQGIAFSDINICKRLFAKIMLVHWSLFIRQLVIRQFGYTPQPLYNTIVGVHSIIRVT